MTFNDMIFAQQTVLGSREEVMSIDQLWKLPRTSAFFELRQDGVDLTYETVVQFLKLPR